ncbi:MAG: LamG domain-containing protein [Bacteroidia bacterium]|nr:LamG domain-containing protein [Bacteroidia bacterium]
MKTKTMRILSSILFVLIVQAGLQAQPCINNTHSLTFNSASVSFSNGSDLAPANAITVEAWIKASSWAFNVFDGTIVCKHSWSNGEQGYVLRAGNNGQADFTVCGLDLLGNPISWQSATSASGIMNLNTWYHVAGTYDGDTLRVFVNGIQQGALPLPGGMLTGTAYPVAIGRLSDQAQFQTRYWTGQMDEVRIWDRALSSSELLSRYNTHLDASQETGLMGYWRFNEGTGTLLNDSSGNGIHGTANLTTWSTNVPFNQTAATPVIIPNGFNLSSSLVASAYQWNLNGTPIPNANTQSWTALANGSYTLTITDSLGCTATSGPYIIAGVGIEEISAGHILLRNDDQQFSISLKNGEKISSMEIFNLSMQRMAAEKGLYTEITWQKSELAKGIYQVLIRTVEGRSALIKVAVL